MAKLSASLENAIKNIRKSKAFIILISILITLFLSYIFFNHIIYSIIFIPYTIYFIKKETKEIAKKKKEELQKDFIEVLDNISFSLDAGYTIFNSFKQSLKMLSTYKCGKEIKVLIFNATKRLENNEPFEKVLYKMAEESKIESVYELSTLIICANETGGDLVEIIKDFVEANRNKENVNKEVGSIIAGKKLEGKCLCFMPLFIILYLKFTMQGFLNPIYTTMIGRIVMIVCAFLYLIAIYIAGKVLEIKM